MGHETGVLAATTAFGKTVVAAWLIAARGVNTLVLVHRRQLLDQWVERLAMFLGMPAKEVGRLGGGRCRLTGAVDVALVQSLVRRDEVRDVVAEYGHLVVDECHHLSAQSFERVARRAKARYVTGLSATVVRRDGHHPIVFMQCGPVRHRVDARRQAAVRPFTHEVVVRPTGFRPRESVEVRPGAAFREVLEALSKDPARNALIRDDILRALAAGLKEAAPHAVVLRGGLGRRALREAMTGLAGVPEGRGVVLLATGSYIGEGFDDPRLDTLFLTMPVSWRGTVAQYCGRLHRLHDGKREVRVYDSADLEVPVLSRMFDRRCRGYEAVGYTILLPAGAMAGWPADVPLPVDPGWKRDHSESVRRLVRDGVDTSLGWMFLGATTPPSPDAEGEARARSAAEAFLYRRLETLPETRGRFQLNADLPIAFDGAGRMEVDLLDPELRLVVELDGAQHLGDPDACRRDRRKDALLQENGYRVLRFLTEDPAGRLDATLDAILRSMAARSRSATSGG